MTAITIDNLSFSYQQRTILNHTQAEFDGINLLIGPSGCGKSTLLKLIAKLLPKYGGQISSGQITVSGPVGILFQDPAMQFALDTPRHELEFTLENCQVPTTEIPTRCQAALEFVNATAFADQTINTLSGGQQQRVALAVVMAMQPKIILLDEPFASVDETNRHFILGRLSQLTGTTIIITDHDPHGYQGLHPTVWRLQAGQLTKLANSTGQKILQAADQQSYSFTPQSPSPQGSLLTATDLQLQVGSRQLLNPSQLIIYREKTTLLTGNNGVGKSTLLKAIAKLKPYQGKIMYSGHDISTISPGKYFQKVGLVFQQANDQFLKVTVEEELALSKRNSHNPYFTSANLTAALEQLGLAQCRSQVVYSLSGGQRKKLQLLLMLMQGQPLLLLDEPFAGLDQASLKAVLTLIQASRQVHPLTIFIISHQLVGLEHFIDYQIHFANRHLISQGVSS